MNGGNRMGFGFGVCRFDFIRSFNLGEIHGANSWRNDKRLDGLFQGRDGRTSGKGAGYFQHVN